MVLVGRTYGRFLLSSWFSTFPPFHFLVCYWEHCKETKELPVACSLFSTSKHVDINI